MKSVVAVLIAISLVCTVAAQDVANIIATSNRFSEAFVAGNTQAMVDFYTEDAIVMAPARDVLTGKQQIFDFWSAVPKNLVSHRCVPDTIVISGNEAHDYGYIFSSTKNADGSITAERTTAKYYIIWRKDAGTWRMKLDMWNSRSPQRP